MTNVPYGGDDASVAMSNGQVVIGQAYTVWADSGGITQVTTGLLNALGVAVGTPYYVYSDQFGQLKFQTTSTQPVWGKAVADPTGQLVQVNPSNITTRVTTIEGTIGSIPGANPPTTFTSNATLSSTQTTALGNAAGGSFTLTLPTAVGRAGIVFQIKKIDSSANTVSIATTSSQQIDGSAATRAIGQQYREYQLISDGSNWWILNDWHPFNTSTGNVNAIGATAGTGSTGLATDAGHQHSYVVPPVGLTDATTIAVNASLGELFRVTLGGNRTMGSPTSPTDGQKIIFEIIQDGTGSRTISWGAAYEFSTSLPAPTLSTTAGKHDFVGFIYNASASLWYCLSFIKGF